VSPEQAEALATAFALPRGLRRLAAWEWGTGPAIVCVHGWSGRAAQFAPLARHLAGRGYRVVAFDVTGHGDSPGWRTSWRCFLDDIAAFAASFDDRIHGWIGHSAGALCLLALRRMGALQAQRWVGLCPPSHPYPPIDQIRMRLAPADTVLAACQVAISKEFGVDWRVLEQGHAFQGLGPETLLVHDTGDRYLRSGNCDRLRVVCPEARFAITENLGHSRILASPVTHRLVADFLGRAES
jgi:pimeloyl-ACP methyl ester carboxylesterase